MRSTSVNRPMPLLAGGLVALAVLALAALPAAAFERYNDGCQGCHGGFTQGGYASRVTGASWPSSLHTVHRSSSYMDTDCDLCHRSDDNDDPFISSSDGTANNVGYGCTGCHGSPTGAGAPDGVSLRTHHVYAGVNDCANVSCHGAPVVVAQESAQPPYYGTVDTRVVSPCNSDASTTEDWNNDGVGLDNDGDLEWDGADPGCQSGFIFHDGFVSGDTMSWVPSAKSH